MITEYGLIIQDQDPLIPSDDGTRVFTDHYDSDVPADTTENLCSMSLNNGDTVVIRAQNDTQNSRKLVYVDVTVMGTTTTWQYSTNWDTWLNPVGLAAYITNPSAPDPTITIELWGDYGEGYEFIRDLGTWDKDEALTEIVIEEWDDTPQADGDTTDDNFGGEFADLMYMSETQDLPWPDLDDFESFNPYSADGTPGLFTPYIMSEGQLALLGKCLYSTGMFNALNQHLDGSSNPVNGILRCIALPFAINTAGGGLHDIGVYGKGIYLDNITTQAVAQGYHFYFGANSRNFRYDIKNFGSLVLKEVWGTARDYTDTSVDIYLPFVGMRHLDSNLVVGKTLELRMYVDAWTGDFLYLLRASNSDIGGKYFSSAGFIGRWTGNCATEIPIGREDVSRPLSALLGGLGAAAMAPMTGGMSLVAGAGSVSSILQNGLQTTGNTSGNLTGSTGFMDVYQAYLLIQRAVPDYPTGWREHIGAVRHQTYTVSDVHGYTEFEEFHVGSAMGLLGCSEEEAAEIERLMKSGVFLP